MRLLSGNRFWRSSFTSSDSLPRNLLTQAAMAMQAYANWAPKEFDESALGQEAGQERARPDAAAAASAAAAAAAQDTTAAAGDGLAQPGAAAAAGPAGVAADAQQQEAEQKQAHFVYDAATGANLSSRQQHYPLVPLSALKRQPDSPPGICAAPRAGREAEAVPPRFPSRCDVRLPNQPFRPFSRGAFRSQGTFWIRRPVCTMTQTPASTTTPKPRCVTAPTDLLPTCRLLIASSAKRASLWVAA